ncbi:hypothetical protein [Mobiluncus porci]|uniref:Lipoprotein n=1 Tax=Mobiluncus porci TaxID=2652278 RepID=A0A7K0K3I9_9ACTO|nr:hypothetical protein [Mobiluncus porci]MST50052.1 hypothetical protein [Mobiluncus porci]
MARPKFLKLGVGLVLVGALGLTGCASMAKSGASTPTNTTAKSAAPNDDPFGDKQFRELGDPTPAPTYGYQLDANVPDGDYEKFLLANVSPTKLITEENTAGIDWVWNHLFRYDGKHKILVAAYVKDGNVLVYDGDLDRLGKDLARPDAEQIVTEGFGCQQYYEYHPQLWILTDDGAIYQPRWPRDRCDHNLPGSVDYPFVPLNFGWEQSSKAANPEGK